MAPRAQEKKLEIGCYVENGLPSHVIGDAARLRQVLLNLAGNAVKFTDSGGIAVVLESGSAAAEIRFLVRDTGIGIAAEQQSRIFFEFEQLDPGQRGRTGGTGLGLAISKRIVEHMGGLIGVDSTPGAGATFRFSLTLPPAPETNELAGPDLTGMDVMIVASNPVVAALVTRQLRDWGARTCLVPDEPMAMALLRERAWSALLIDHGVGGPACERLARVGVPRRVVLITPTERQELPALREAGFAGYLVKPVRAESLAAQLLLGEHSFERSAALELRPSATERTASVLSVLVAEHNEINALLSTALLKRLGHRVTLATTGHDAVEAWLKAEVTRTPYDLLLMDIEMPGGSGVEAARRIRAMEAERGAQRVPMFALTANAFDEDRAACLAAGMDAF